MSQSKKVVPPSRFGHRAIVMGRMQPATAHSLEGKEGKEGKEGGHQYSPFYCLSLFILLAASTMVFLWCLEHLEHFWGPLTLVAVSTLVIVSMLWRYCAAWQLSPLRRRCRNFHSWQICVVCLFFSFLAGGMFALSVSAVLYPSIPGSGSGSCSGYHFPQGDCTNQCESLVDIARDEWISSTDHIANNETAKDMMAEQAKEFAHMLQRLGCTASPLKKRTVIREGTQRIYNTSLHVAEFTRMHISVAWGMLKDYSTGVTMSTALHFSTGLNDILFGGQVAQLPTLKTSTVELMTQVFEMRRQMGMEIVCNRIITSSAVVLLVFGPPVYQLKTVGVAAFATWEAFFNTIYLAKSMYFTYFGGGVVGGITDYGFSAIDMRPVTGILNYLKQEAVRTLAVGYSFIFRWRIRPWDDLKWETRANDVYTVLTGDCKDVLTDFTALVAILDALAPFLTANLDSLASNVELFQAMGNVKGPTGLSEDFTKACKNKFKEDTAELHLSKMLADTSSVSKGVFELAMSNYNVSAMCEEMANTSVLTIGYVLSEFKTLREKAIHNEEVLASMEIMYPTLNGSYFTKYRELSQQLIGINVDLKREQLEIIVKNAVSYTIHRLFVPKLLLGKDIRGSKESLHMHCATSVARTSFEKLANKHNMTHNDVLGMPIVLRNLLPHLKKPIHKRLWKKKNSKALGDTQPLQNSKLQMFSNMVKVDDAAWCAWNDERFQRVFSHPLIGIKRPHLS